MFEKLAPKLNGANVSSNQGTSQTSATGSNQITTLAGSGTRPLHVTSNARPPSNSITPQSAGIKSAAGSGQGLSTKRPNPFDKGFPGLDNQPPLTVSANIPHGLKATAAKDRSNNTTKGPSLERSAHVQVYQGSTSNARPSGRGQQALVDRPLMPVGSERDTGNDHLDSAWLANPSQIKEIERDTPDSWSSTPPAPLSQTSQQSLLSPKQVPVRATTLSQSVSSVTVSGSSSKKPEKATTVRGSFSKKLETTTTTAISNPSNAPNQLSIRSSSPTIKSSAVAQLVTVVYSNNVAPKAPLTSATSRPSTSRPEGQDTVDRRNSPAHQKQPNPVIEIQDNERRGLLRSNSSPSAASSSSPQFNRPKRRLPGPAGNLPILSAEEKEQLFRSRGVPFTKDTRITVVGITGSDSSIKKRIEPIHQGPIDSMFANGAWDDMLKAYRLPDYRPSTLLRWKGTHPMIKYSISDIERTMELHHGKFPNLVAMIKELVPSEIDAAVTLLDPSGEMRGTIHKTVLEQYKNNEIRIGTVLALQNVSVFSPRTASHYLIITLRNIGALFQPHPPTMMLSQGSSQDKESQRKRKSGPDSQDSQEGKTGNTSFSNPGGAVLADPSPKSEPLAHSNTNLSPQSSFYDLDDSILNHHLSQEGHQKTVKSAPPSQSKKQKQVHPKPALGRLSQGDSYTQEINFQSLQQPFDSSIAPDRYNKSQNDDVEPTPIIPLGTSTPVIASTMSILASFAAAPSLRKRTSSTTSHLETRSSPQRAIPNPRVLASPISPTITRSDPADISNLSDWPDDLGDIDLEALEEDSNGLVNPQPDQMEEPVGSSVGGMYKVDMLATVESNVDDNGDDDLDRLLDGLDEDAFDDL
ncbi:hypothetical protein B0O80DRAFT_202774 [Mortierella sp. GBAus27b]|nr:hypothetical protein B0O80DRAFT_202774 [Mortierella sp. GBAus27b]